jgi:hypothetical protein
VGTERIAAQVRLILRKTPGMSQTVPFKGETRLKIGFGGGELKNNPRNLKIILDIGLSEWSAVTIPVFFSAIRKNRSI